MKWNTIAASALLTVGMLFSAAAISTVCTAQAYDYYDMGRLRGLIDRTQSDLRSASELERNNGKQSNRYRDAQRTLSDFDRHVTKGHFDKGKLNQSIDRIKGILDHNTLQASSRDGLLRDIEDLRIARDHFTR